MTFPQRHLLSRRHFCLCCIAGATFAATNGWLTPREAFAEARGLVSLIKDSAAVAPIVTHRLRNNVSVLEGSGGNIAVLTGPDGKVLIDAGIGVSRPQITKALADSAPIRSPISSTRTGTSTMPTATNGCIRSAPRSSRRRIPASTFPASSGSRTGTTISFPRLPARSPARSLRASAA